MTNGSVPATDTPVFVDHSGTRRRWFAVLGVTGAAGLTLAVVLLVAGFLGSGPGGLPFLPAPPVQPVQATQQAERLTSGTPAPSGSGRLPRPGATPSAGQTPAPGSTQPGPPFGTAASAGPGRGSPPPHPSPSHRK